MIKTVKSQISPNAPNFQKLMRSLNIENFFEENVNEQILHFFEPKSKNLYFVEIGQLEKIKHQMIQENRYSNSDLDDEPMSYFKKELVECEFDIPRHHKSLSIPEGCIVITGGLEESSEGQILYSKYLS